MFAAGLVCAAGLVSAAGAAVLLATSSLAYTPQPPAPERVSPPLEGLSLGARPTKEAKGGLPPALRSVPLPKGLDPARQGIDPAPQDAIPAWGAGNPAEDGPAGDEPHDHGRSGEATPVPEPAASLADVSWDAATLPAPVQRTRTALLKAARTGNIEALRPIFDDQGRPPVVAHDVVDDAVAHLRLQSGDDEGREILAILVELLEAGFVHTGSETAGTFVWPYFAEVSLEELKDPHYVELYRVLTAIDVEEMARLGQYTFFRVGISADGRLRYFTAGALE